MPPNPCASPWYVPVFPEAVDDDPHPLRTAAAATSALTEAAANFVPFIPLSSTIDILYVISQSMYDHFKPCVEYRVKAIFHEVFELLLFLRVQQLYFFVYVPYPSC